MRAARILLPTVIAVFTASTATDAAAGDAGQRLQALRAEAAALENGEGVTKDPLRALELYCEAARAGDAEAQYEMGWMYANGRGVLRNEALASVMFAMAAEQGHSQARSMLDHLPPPTVDLPQCMHDESATAEYDDRQVIFAEQLDQGETTPFIPANATEARIQALVNAIAPEYQVNPTLALAFIRAESNFDQQARSPKNAQGLMQLIPETSARFNVKKPYDPVQNIRGGLAYLRWLLAYFRGSVPLVAAAYNAGEGTVERYRGIPPYAETRQYVSRIMQLFRKREHPFDPTVTDASPELQRIKTSNIM